MLGVCNAAALPPLQTGEKLGYCQGSEPWYKHAALLMQRNRKLSLLCPTGCVLSLVVPTSEL